MNSMHRTNQRIGFLLTLLPLGAGLALLSPLRADDNSDLIKDAHHQLSLALNLGGDTPSDADRTADINAAISDLKDITFASGRADYVKSVAEKDLKAALLMISRGDPDHGAEKDIRDADSIVRDLEG